MYVDTRGKKHDNLSQGSHPSASYTPHPLSLMRYQRNHLHLRHQDPRLLRALSEENH